MTTDAGKVCDKTDAIIQDLANGIDFWCIGEHACKNKPRFYNTEVIYQGTKSGEDGNYGGVGMF